jgi:hypothetical protein
VTIPSSTLIFPEAIAPSVMPSSTGVMMLAMEKTRLQRCCTSSRALSYVRNVKAEPRSTMPISSRVKGICSAVAIVEKAGGKPVKRMTKTRISQTWFASQTGPMASAINARCFAPRFPRANKSHTPPP